MNIMLSSLGCRLNQAERESWERAIQARGHLVVSDPTLADWAIVNTCTVTHVAARKSRQLVRHLHRENPALRIAVTGCYADISPDQTLELAGVAWVLPNAAKDEIVDRILSDSVPSITPEPAIPPLVHERGRTRSIVKVQDGCDHHCTYCIVTVARGPQRSISPEQVLADIVQRVGEGYREIVLTGVSLGAYGRDSAPGAPLPPSAGWSLARLVRDVLAKTSVERLRLSSIEPWDVTPELISLWDSPRMCRHLHLSLQSGCDATLKRMGRPYTSDMFRSLTDALLERIPGISLTTDIIVGFPGETDDEYAQSLAYVREIGFARLHVFRYSSRPGTPATQLSGQIAPPIAQQRHRDMSELGQQLAMTFHKKLLGHLVHVLLEQSLVKENIQYWQGLTDNYVRVLVASHRDLRNHLVTARCTHADAAGLHGCLIERNNDSQCPPSTQAQPDKPHPASFA